MKHESKCINLTVEKIAITDEYNTQKRESFLQSQFWADFKSKQGWQNTFFCGTFQTVNQDNDSDFNDFSFSASVLIRPLLKFFSVAYIPMGPTVYPHIKNHTDFLDFLVQFSKKIRAFLPKNVLYIRFDPPIRFFNMNERDDFIQKNIYAKKNLCKSPVNVQPQDTILLDLRKTADELLTAMKPKWRYNIRLAEKKGVKIYSAAGNTDIHEAVEIFYELYKETAKRDGIAIHKKEYYKNLIDLAKNYNDITITVYIARHENDNLAAIVALFTKNEAVYLYGASADKKRNLMPSYLLQWTVIQDAKKTGIEVYDFYGLPPTNDKNHPMHGLYRFKTGFGGTIIHTVGSVDVKNSAFYFPYIVAEALRSWYHKKVKKFFVGR